MSDHCFVVRRIIDNSYLNRGVQPQLSRLDIELTERCNNNCVHCYINLPQNDKSTKYSELSTYDWKQVLHQAAELGALTVRFTGGEPLLRDDFVDIYLHARKLGIKVVISTNARLITNELADLLAKYPPLKKVEISVYGITSETYENVTRDKGSFLEFQNGVRLLHEKHIPLLLRSVLLPSNLIEMIDSENRDTKFLNNNIFFSSPTLLNLYTRGPSQNRNQIIKNMRFTPDQIIALMIRKESNFRNYISRFAKDFLYPQGPKLFNCGAGEIGCVDAYGKYQMCMLLRHPKTVYNLKTGSIRDALTDFFPKLREMQATNPDYLERCSRCFLKGLCEQCPAKSWSEYGTLDSPVEYLCEVAHSQARLLGLLAETEQSWEIDDWKARIDHFSKETNISLKENPMGSQLFRSKGNK